MGSAVYPKDVSLSRFPKLVDRALFGNLHFNQIKDLAMRSSWLSQDWS